MPRRPKSLLPQPSDLRARSSSITYAIAASAAPYSEPADKELDEMFEILGMDRENMHCAFCGRTTKKLGHLNSLVEDRRPTGWGTTIGNVIPVCRECSSSRGNQPWADWVQHKMADKNWPGLPGVIERIQRITLLEQRFPGRKLDWSKLPPGLAQEFIEQQARADQALERLHEIGRKIMAYYNSSR